MLQSSEQNVGENGSEKRLSDYLRTTRDRVFDSGFAHFWFRKWVVAALAAILLVAIGVVLLVRSDIDFDTFLNYFALGLLIFVLITLFYGIIAIHDVPYEIAKHRNHPHQDAIHAAGWVSLFTLHALWPFLWIWAMLYRPERGWGVTTETQHDGAGGRIDREALDALHARLDRIEARLDKRGR